MAMSNLLTHSRRSTAMSCLRKHYYQYELGVRPLEDGAALRFGSAFHCGLEHFGKGQSMEDSVHEALKYFDEGAAGLSDERLDKYLLQREQLFRMLYGHFWMYPKMTVLETELGFDLPILNENGNPIQSFRMAGKIDAIVELEDGRVAVLEYKTTSQDISAGSSYWKRVLIDTQVAAYQIAAKELGYDIECVIYDVTKKPTINPKTLTQGDTAVFLSTGEYFGEHFDINRIDSRVLVDGVEAEIIPGKKADAIKETLGMYGQRLTADIWERPDHYYRRQEVTRLACDEEEMRFEILSTARLLADCQKYHRWPKNTANCVGFGTCPYLDICFAGGLEADSALPDGFIRLDNVHPELE